MSKLAASPTGLTQTQMIERWIQSEKARIFNP
ncbi:TPA: hypothetical protein MD380_004578 [Klebsiella pneumoniae]|nr:hypothetical protein [Klebsiella pneumoniae]HBQ0943239.1 hypothetical protein [Klebsiella pneumoniae]HBU7683359.1 hypothetical protein [Klebsiella pneumoniae]HBV6621272.1 hypothetical protein [Klebsiella pneumoniae]